MKQLISQIVPQVVIKTVQRYSISEGRPFHSLIVLVKFKIVEIKIELNSTEHDAQINDKLLSGVLFGICRIMLITYLNVFPTIPNISCSYFTSSG